LPDRIVKEILEKIALINWIWDFSFELYYIFSRDERLLNLWDKNKIVIIAIKRGSKLDYPPVISPSNKPVILEYFSSFY
jgi:hypothetical protein